MHNVFSLERMLCRGIRTFCSVRVPLLALRMSAPVPTGSAAAPKRALSTSPPPPPASSLPIAASSSSSGDAVAPAAARTEESAPKKVKLTVEEPASVPPNLVEEPASTESTEVQNSRTTEAGGDPAAPAPAAKVSTTTGGKAARKPRQRKGKAPKPGGVEEAGAFDVIELLGAERVKELQRLQEEEGRDWTKEAELEWGKGPEGKDVEVRVVGSNDHGASLFVCGTCPLRRGRRISRALSCVYSVLVS